jgi:hypothetical protein
MTIADAVSVIKTGERIWRAAKPITRIKRKLNKRRARKGKPLLEINEETDMLRTSTGAGLAGIAINIILQILQAFSFTAELASSPEFAAGLTTVVMWAIARLWKTPKDPGIV